jgi:hypothetical protein
VQAIRFGINAKATQYLLTSVELFPFPNNMALRQLLKIYAITGNAAKFYQAKSQYIRGDSPAWCIELESLLIHKKTSLI